MSGVLRNRREVKARGCGCRHAWCISVAHSPLRLHSRCSDVTKALARSHPLRYAPRLGPCRQRLPVLQEPRGRGAGPAQALPPGAARAAGACSALPGRQWAGGAVTGGCFSRGWMQRRAWKGTPRRLLTQNSCCGGCQKAAPVRSLRQHHVSSWAPNTLPCRLWRWSWASSAAAWMPGAPGSTVSCPAAAGARLPRRLHGAHA